MPIPDSQQEEIYDLRVGDSYPLERTYLLSDKITVTSVSVVIKRYYQNPDNSIIPVITVTSDLSANGQISDPGTASGTLILTALIPASSTALIDANLVYVFGVKGVDSAGLEYTFEAGKIFPLPEVVTGF